MRLVAAVTYSGGFFARIFVWLFREQGLILMDSDDPAIRGLEGPMFTPITAEA